MDNSLKIPDKGYVYLGRYSNGLTKIGMTTLPKTRDRYDSFKIFHTIRTDQKMLVEKRLHIHYKYLCVGGEDFRLSDRDVAELVSIKEMEIGVSRGEVLFLNALRRLSLKERGITVSSHRFGALASIRRVANVTHETVKALDVGAMALHDEGCFVYGDVWNDGASFSIAFCKSDGWRHLWDNEMFSAKRIFGL